jgi:ArsR family transcriptional regulator
MTLENISQTFKALSDPIRLKILYLLTERDSLCVCEIVEILSLNQSTVSRHLAYLKNSNIVNSWREGVWMHYSLKKEMLPMIKIAELKNQLENTEEISIVKKCIKKDGQICSIKK